jgi:hypothetical protein
MTKDERRKGFAVALVIAVLAAAVVMNEDARREARHWQKGPAAYYAMLEESCGDGCCRASVDEMRRAQAEIQPPTGCPAGESADMLHCASSYRWCAAE